MGTVPSERGSQKNVRLFWRTPPPNGDHSPEICLCTLILQIVAQELLQHVYTPPDNAMTLEISSTGGAHQHHEGSSAGSTGERPRPRASSNGGYGGGTGGTGGGTQPVPTCVPPDPRCTVRSPDTFFGCPDPRFKNPTTKPAWFADKICFKEKSQVQGASSIKDWCCQSKTTPACQHAETQMCGSQGWVGETNV